MSKCCFRLIHCMVVIVYLNSENSLSFIQIDSHEDDINAVTFADDSSQILFSGGDDGLVKVRYKCR